MNPTANKIVLPICAFIVGMSALFCSSPQSHAQDELKKADAEKSDLKASPLQQKNTNPKTDQDDIVAPWEERKIDNSLPDLHEVSPRDLLVDVDEGEIENLADPGEIEPGDSTLLKVMYRISRFAQFDLRTFGRRNQNVAPDMIARSANDYRMNVLPISARAKKLVRIKLPERVAELYELIGKDGKERNFDSYYQVDALLQPGNIAATVCLVDVPEQWLSAKEMDEPFSANAMFLKLSNDENEPAELLFAAKNLEWFPESSAIDESLDGGPLLLAELGFDASLLSDASARNRKSINAVDADCFYRLLSVATDIPGDSEKQKLVSNSEIPVFDLVEVMNNPMPHHGDLYMVDADIRRITRVEVDADLYREFFQLDHYFQLDGFVDTDVMIKDPNLEKEGLPGYGKRYPISICVPELPPGMKAGERRVYQVELPAFYFKTWTFKSQLSRDHDPRLRHVAPLMIGLQPEIKSSKAVSSNIPFVIVTTLCIALFGFIWFGFWRQSRLGKESRKTRFKIGQATIAVEGEEGKEEVDKQVPSSGEGNNFPELRR